MIQFIPYRMLTFATHLPVEEIRYAVLNIKKDYGRRVVDTIALRQPGPGEGVAFHFEISRERDQLYQFDFNPLMRGRVIDNLDHRQIVLSVYPKFINLFVIGCALFIALLIAFFSGPRPLWAGLALLGVLYFAIIVDFNRRTTQMVDFLKSVLQEAPEFL